MDDDVTELVNPNLDKMLSLQVTEGCDRFECDQPYCKGCKDFIAKSQEEQLNLIESLSDELLGKQCVCPGLSPFIKEENLFAKIQNFDKTISKYLDEDNYADVTQNDLLAMKQILCDPDSFQLILCSIHNDKIPYKFTKLYLTDDLLYSLFNFVTNQGHTLKKISQNLLTMFDFFLAKNLDTRSHVRGLILLFCFIPFYQQNRASNNIFRLISHVLNEISQKARQFFWKKLENFPNFNRRVINYVVEFLTANVKNIVNVPMKLDTISLFCQNVFNIRMSEPELYVCDKLKGLISEDFVAESIMKNELNIGFSWNLINFDRKFKFDVFMKIVDTKVEIEQRNSIRQHRINRRQIPGINTVVIDRNNITQTALTAIEEIPPNELLLPFKVTFAGEEGDDYGGLTREFFYKLSGIAFSPDYGMFRFVNSQFYWFTVISEANQGLYKLLGTVVALGVVNRVPIPVRFPLLMYKKLLGKTIILDDLEEVDPYFVSGVKNMKEMKEKGQNIEDLCLYFTSTVSNLGELVDVPIVEGGNEIPVTNENFETYVELYIQWYTNDSIEHKFAAFSTGFTNVIQPNYLRIFTPQDLDQLVSGDQQFDWKALKSACKYRGYSRNSRPIKWLWDVFENVFNNNDRRAFLKFVTGCDYAPIGGLGEVELIIEKTDTINLLPTAHTCMNTLTFPAYKTKEQVKKALQTIIQHTEGFGFR